MKYDQLNRKSNKNNKDLFFFMLILSVTFFMMYILNNNTYFTSDDYRYHYIYKQFMPTDNEQRIKSFYDIVKSMHNHYNIWGGRIVAHTFVQSFLMFGKPVFNILNSLAFVVLSLLVYWHCNAFRKINVQLMLVILLMLWFFIPQFGASVLWVSGSGNYLWCSIMIFAFLLPYRLYIDSSKYFKDNFINMIFMLLFGIIAGWTNENTGGAMIMLEVFFMLYYINNKIKLPKWSISGLISSIIGFVLLVIAPGNYVRPNKDVSFLLRLERLRDNSYEVIFIPIVILIVLYIIFINTDKNNKMKNLVIPTMYIIVAIASIGALILTPYAPQRTWFGSIIFTIIAIGYIYARLDFKNNLIKQTSIALIILFSISCLYEYGKAYVDINNTYIQVIRQIKVIEKEKEKGKKEISVNKLSKPKSQYNALKNTVNVSSDKNSWFNSWMAKYYGIDYIIGEN